MLKNIVGRLIPSRLVNCGCCEIVMSWRRLTDIHTTADIELCHGLITCFATYLVGESNHYEKGNREKDYGEA
jgi:hypothetical protein